MAIPFEQGVRDDDDAPSRRRRRRRRRRRPVTTARVRSGTREGTRTPRSSRELFRVGDEAEVIGPRGRVSGVEDADNEWHVREFGPRPGDTRTRRRHFREDARLDTSQIIDLRGDPDGARSFADERELEEEIRSQRRTSRRGRAFFRAVNPDASTIARLAARRAELQRELEIRGNRPGGPVPGAGSPTMFSSPGEAADVAFGDPDTMRQSGWGLEDIPGGLKNIADFYTGIPTAVEDPSLANIGFAAAGLFPFGRAGSLAARGGRAALRPRWTRTLRVGDTPVAEIPSASSRTGAAAERIYDKVQRTVAPRYADYKALSAARRSTERYRQFTGAAAGALSQAGKKLSAEQQAALFYVAEGAPLSERAAYHATMASRLRDAARNAKRGQTRLAIQRSADMHDLSRRIVAGASRYIDDSGGVLRVADNAPKNVHEAQRLIEQAGSTREDILQAIDPDLADSLAERVHGPTRKITGDEAATGNQYMPHSRGTPGNSRFNPRLIRKASAAVISRRQGAITRAVGNDPHLKNEWTGALMDSGLLRTDAANLTAESLLRASKLDALRHYRGTLLAISKSAEEVAELGDDITRYLPILADLNAPGVPKNFRSLLEQLETGQLSKQSLQQFDDKTIGALRDAIFGRVAGETPEGVRYVRGDLFDRAIAEATQYRALGDRQTTGLARGASATLKNLNDLQRFAILYINPFAYGVTNLLGNTALALMQQGAFAPVRAAQALRISKRLPKEDLVALDQLAGVGNILATFAPQGVIRKGTQGYINMIHKMVDMVPRRMAMLHELSAIGIKTPDEISQLMREARAGSKTAWKKLDQSAARANDAMVDFERLNPVERNIVSRILFVYPWVKGATRYTARFPLEHPVATGGLAVAAKEQQENRPEGPFYTESLVIFPEWFPYVGGKAWDPSTIVPFKIPFDLGRGIASLAMDTGDAPQFFDDINPLISSGVYALTGRDEFGRELEGGFFGQGGGVAGELGEQIVDNSRLATTVREFQESPQEQAGDIYPHTRNDLIARTLIGSAAPREFNEKVSAARAEEIDKEDEPTVPRYEQTRREKRQRFKDFYARYNEPVPKEITNLIDLEKNYKDNVDAARRALKLELFGSETTGDLGELREAHLEVAVLIEMLVDRDRLDEEDAELIRETKNGAPKETVYEYRRELREMIGFSQLESWERELKKLMEEAA